MLQMAFEREVIVNIRYRVDAYDDECLFDDVGSGPDADASVTRSNVRLGSLDKIIHLGSYAKKLSIDICLQDFQSLLAAFLRLNHVPEAEASAISSFEVRISYAFIGRVPTAVQVVPCHTLLVTYNCQEMATKKTDVLHVTTSWRNSGARYDCAILRGSGRSGLNFCQVCAIFMISIAHEWYRLAVVRIYEQKRRNKITGHIELVAPKDRRFELCFVESVVRIAHILPPTRHTACSIVQDLYDSDMYLRLHHIQ